MARNAIKVDQSIFQGLREHVAARGSATLPDATRWLAGGPEDKALVVHTSVLSRTRFSRHRAVLLLKFEERVRLALLGFDFDVWPLADRLTEEEADSSGMISLALYESRVAPIASSYEVLNVAGPSKESDPDYSGHPAEVVAKLFPRLRVIDLEQDATGASTWPLILRLCVQECLEGSSWIEQPLADSLRDLADLHLEQFPYESVCRAIFDLDPRSLFLAVYRVIEAAYAFVASTRIKTQLGSHKTWYEIAEELATVLSWRPRHGEALLDLLREAEVSRTVLVAVCDATHESVGPDAAISAGRAIRDLRNRIVHYGPSTQGVSIEDYDWNELCVALLAVLSVVFRKVFGSVNLVQAGGESE